MSEKKPEALPEGWEEHAYTMLMGIVDAEEYGVNLRDNPKAYEAVEDFLRAMLPRLRVSQKAALALPTEQQACDMGAKGAAATDAERLLFEAWMRGHCWALCARWDGKCYRSDAEQSGNIDPKAMNTRQLWAAWRDRAALATPMQQADQQAQP